MQYFKNFPVKVRSFFTPFISVLMFFLISAYYSWSGHHPQINQSGVDIWSYIDIKSTAFSAFNTFECGSWFIVNLYNLSSIYTFMRLLSVYGMWRDFNQFLRSTFRVFIFSFSHLAHYALISVVHCIFIFKFFYFALLFLCYQLAFIL